MKRLRAPIHGRVQGAGCRESLRTQDPRRGLGGQVHDYANEHDRGTAVPPAASAHGVRRLPSA